MQYRGLQLDAFQAEAIEALERGESVLVAAPTGTGKTVVADWVVESALEQGKEVIYTAPIKALSNQKFRDYCKLFGEEKVGLVTGDLVIRRDAPCRVMTTEILRNILLTGEDLPHLAAVVIDEIHFLDDIERGTVWEEVLIYLPPSVQIVGLSATLSNLPEFANWLKEVREGPVHVILEEKRAVPLSYQIATRERGLVPADKMAGVYQKWFKDHGNTARRSHHKQQQRHQQRGRRGRRDREGPRISAPTRHHTVFRLMVDGDNLPYLYFVFSRHHAESLARDLGRRLGEDTVLDGHEQMQMREQLDAFEQSCGDQSVLRRDHRRVMEQGIGYHHAGLHVGLKALTERLYEAKLIKVLYCTGTFALGINMPARAACFDAMMRFDGRKLIPLPAREFMQMAGRAGRRGMDESGMVVVRTDMEDWPGIEPQLKSYLTGRTEPVKSRFSLSFNSVVNLMDRHRPDQVRQFVEKSFLAYYRRHTAERESRNAERLSVALEAEGWDGSDDAPRHLKKQVRRMNRLTRRADEQTDRTWAEFQAKVDFLTRWGYLGEDGTFNAGAKALMEVQISEIFSTELFLAGVFDPLEPDRLFGLLTAMCTEFPKRVDVHTVKRDRRLGWKAAEIRESAMVREAEALTRVEVDWDPRLIGLGTMWAQDKSLTAILAHVQSNTDISGDLVGAFRRAKELAGQLRSLWVHDKARQAQLTQLIRQVNRDEVAAVG